MENEVDLQELMKEVQEKKGFQTTPEETAKIHQALKEIVNEGKKAVEAIGFSKEMCDFIYTNGYRLFQSGKYDDAYNIFWLMHLLDPEELKYLIGMATTRHQQKVYNEAIIHYQLWALSDMRDPNPLYHCADCYIALNDLENARLTLKAMIERCKPFPNLSKMQNRGEAMLQSLTEQLAAAKSAEKGS